MKKIAVIVAAVVAIVAVVLAVRSVSDVPQSQSNGTSLEEDRGARGIPAAHGSSDRVTAASPADPQAQKDEISSGDDSEPEEEPQTEEEKREAEEEKLVNDFDDLTDKW